MTLILARKQPAEKVIYFAQDGYISGTGTAKCMQAKKCWRLGDKLLVGGAGDLSFLQTLQTFLHIPADNHETGMELLMNVVRPQVQKWAKEPPGGDGRPDFELMFTDGDDIFYYGSDHAILKIDADYWAIGSGGSYALGILEYATGIGRHPPTEQIFVIVGDLCSEIGPLHSVHYMPSRSKLTE